MTVKELITILLDFDRTKEVTIEYPNDSGLIVGNYSRYSESKDFDINEYGHGVILGIDK